MDQCKSTHDGKRCAYWLGHHGFHLGGGSAWGYMEGDENKPKPKRRTRAKRA